MRSWLRRCIIKIIHTVRQDSEALILRLLKNENKRKQNKNRDILQCGNSAPALYLSSVAHRQVEEEERKSNIVKAIANYTC